MIAFSTSDFWIEALFTGDFALPGAIGVTNLDLTLERGGRIVGCASVKIADTDAVIPCQERIFVLLPVPTGIVHGVRCDSIRIEVANLAATGHNVGYCILLLMRK